MPSLRALLAWMVLAAAPALADGGPDLNDFALGWTVGRYAAPLVCEQNGTPHRVLRQLRVGPGPRDARPAQARLQLQDLEQPKARRCFLELGGEEPNVTGFVSFTLPGRSHTDTAQRDFEIALRRDGGFDFEIKSGVLRVTGWGDEASRRREVDFAGGRARLHRVARGSDAERLLGEIPPERRFTLELEARDGTLLRFHVARIGAR